MNLGKCRRQLGKIWPLPKFLNLFQPEVKRLIRRIEDRIEMVWLVNQTPKDKRQSLSLSLSIYIYIYIYMLHLYYIYIYIYDSSNTQIHIYLLLATNRMQYKVNFKLSLTDLNSKFSFS